jgi:16S rRNA (guanine527-N7)-methyltransferase
MASAGPAVSKAVLEVLEDAQRQGFVGPGPLGPHVVHSLGFADAASRKRGHPFGPGDRVADLGSGAGLPGLILADAFPEVAFTLVEGSTRRAAFLGRAVESLHWDRRVEVIGARAEVVGRQAGMRGAYTVVVARLFGPPAATAECAAPLLQTGGWLVVSEPPDPAGARWAGAGLAVLGLTTAGVVAARGGSFATLEQVHPCPDRFPRRTGVPAKRPLFS